MRRSIWLLSLTVLLTALLAVLLSSALLHLLKLAAKALQTREFLIQAAVLIVAGLRSSSVAAVISARAEPCAGAGRFS